MISILHSNLICYGGVSLRADFKNMDIGFLSDFLKQSQTGNLETKGLYPDKETVI